jgi:hypothetical protein
MAETTTKTGGDTVVVGCTLPNGLVLQLSELREGNEAVPGGFRSVKQARRLPETYTLRGTAYNFNPKPADNPMLVAGFSITPGIPKEFWERWLAINADSDVVRNGLVFAASDDARARPHAAENAKQNSGLEPIDPDAPAVFGRDVRRIEAGTRT